MKDDAQSRSGAPIGDSEVKRACLVGGGTASLASAVYLIRDGHLPGKNIHFFLLLGFIPQGMC